jgi:hypothetical protein
MLISHLKKLSGKYLTIGEQWSSKDYEKDGYVCKPVSVEIRIL